MITQVGSFDTQGVAVAVTVENNTVFLADKSEGLRIIDVSTPSNPIEIGFYNTSGYTQDVVVKNGIAYLADGDQGLQLVDVNDIRKPKPIGSGFVINDDAQSVVVTEKIAFVRFLNSLEIVDISDSSNLKSLSKIGYYDGISLGSVGAIAIKDGVLFACTQDLKLDGGYELKLFNVSDPTNPTAMNSYPLSTGRPENIVISGNHAFVSYRANGIDVFDIGNTDDIKLQGHSFGWDQSLAVSNNNIITASGGAADLLDISNLTAPPNFLQSVIINKSINDGHAVDVAINGNYAYIADSTGGLKVVNFSNGSESANIGSGVASVLLNTTPIQNVTVVQVENTVDDVVEDDPEVPVEDVILDYSLSIENTEIDEGSEDTITFTVSASDVSDVDVEIPFTLSGSATINKDYQGDLTETSFFTIPAGEISVDLSFTANVDFLVEKDETVILTLGEPSNQGSILEEGSATAVIHNVFQGKNTADKWVGSDKNDKAFGNGGNDILSAGLGDDTVDGGDGNDKITGGKGVDVLSGGDGKDTFIFKKGDSSDELDDSIDTILDLSEGDSIDLSGVSKSFNLVKTVSEDLYGSDIELSYTKADIYIANLDGDNYLVYETARDGSSYEIVAIGYEIPEVSNWVLKSGVLSL